MRKTISNHSFIRFLAVITLAAGLFFMTDASKVSSVVIMVGFLLLTGVIYYLIYGITVVLAFYGFRIKRRRLVSGYLTGVFSVLIALQSIGEMGRWDFWVLLPLALLAYFYNSYAKANSPKT